VSSKGVNAKSMSIIAPLAMVPTALILSDFLKKRVIYWWVIFGIYCCSSELTVKLLYYKGLSYVKRKAVGYYSWME
jgi:hypothetical protein